MKRIIPNKIFATFIILILIISQTTSLSQTRNLRFDHFSIKDGLPDNGLNCVLQDHLGFIWIATRNGLSKYDGYTFNNYSLLNEGSDKRIFNRIWYLMEDTQGDIWAALKTGGLAIFSRDEERFEFYFHEDNNPNSLSDKGIFTMLEDSKGNIWIGTGGDGLDFIDRKFSLNKDSGLVFQHIEIDDSIEGANYVTAIHEDLENNIWVCTYNGLFYISDSLRKLIQPIKSNKSFLLNRISSIFLDSKDNLWGGIHTGLLLFDRENKQYTRFINDPFDPNSINEGPGFVPSIMEDNVGNIWITQNEGKLNKINPQKNLFQYYRDYKIDNDQIKFYRYTRMLIARDGKIWFASENGLFEYLPKEDLFIKMKDKNES